MHFELFGGILMDYTLSVEQIKQSIQDKLNHTFVVSPENATDEEFYKACALIVRELMAKGRSEFVQNAEKNRHQADLLPLHGVPAGPFPAQHPVQPEFGRQLPQGIGLF